MAYCLTHKLFYTQKCPRCQPRKQQDEQTTPRNAANYRSTDLTTRDRAIQLLGATVASLNSKTRSRHAWRIENDELVVVLCESRANVTFAHAPFSPDLWGGIVNTLKQSDGAGSPQEMQAVILTMENCGGRVYSFRL
jgi:hypothetical protein